MIVVKLGGSLYNTPELKRWLHTLAELSVTESIVIVPGGGPFADQVRDAQAHHHFDDNTAHHMALVAMKQFGLMLSSLEAKCLPFHPQQPSQKLSVWLPDDSLLSEPDLIPSWDLSSDSIALWLASKLGAERLFLIKQSEVKSTSIVQLTADKIIDCHFTILFDQFPIQAQIIHYQSYTDFAKTIVSDHPESHLQLS